MKVSLFKIFFVKSSKFITNYKKKPQNSLNILEILCGFKNSIKIKFSMENHSSNGKNVFKSAVDHSKSVFKRIICIFPSYRRKFVRETASKRSFPFCEMVDEIHPIRRIT